MGYLHHQLRWGSVGRSFVGLLHYHESWIDHRGQKGVRAWVSPQSVGLRRQGRAWLLLLVPGFGQPRSQQIRGGAKGSVK